MPNSFNIKIPDEVTSSIIDNYIESMKDSLLKGKKFYIKGLGYLIPKFRKVKNDSGRNFTITIKLKQDSQFTNQIIASCLDDPDRFSK